MPPNVDGISAASALLNRTSGRDQSNRTVYFEFCWHGVANTPAKVAKAGSGNITPIAYDDGWAQAVRWGNWKGIRVNQGDSMLLYDLSVDEGEMHNVNTSHPEVIATLKQIMAEEHEDNPYWPAGTDTKPCCQNCFKKDAAGCPAACLHT